MGWQDAPIVKTGTPSVQPAWMTAPLAPPAAAPRVGWAEENLAGPSEVLGSALANLPGGAINAVSDLVHRLGGNDSSAPLVPSVPVGAGGRQLLGDAAKLPGIEQAISGAGAADTALGKASPTLQDVVHGAGHVAADVGAIAPVAGLGEAAAGIPAEMAASRAAASAPIAAHDIEGALKAVGYPSLPSKTEDAGGAARTGASVVGEGTLTGPQTLTSQAVTNRLAQHEAGVPATEPLSYESVANARAAGPGKVYDAAHDAMPAQLTQDPRLQSDIATVEGTTSQLPKSPDVEALKQAMLGQPDMTRDELFQNISQARDRASRFYSSDQPDAHEIGDAYQGIANAYESFVGRQLAANPVSPVSLQDWQDARTQFAKNYAVQSALRGTSVDASKLATLQRKDPGNLTGGLQLIAEQQNRYPLSTGFGPTTLADTGIGSSGSIAGNTARHITGPLLGGGIGALAGHFTGLGPVAGGAIGSGVGQLASAGLQNIIRRALAGTPAGGAEAANAAIENPQLSSFFGEEAAPGPQHETLPPFPGAQPPLSLADELGAGGTPKGPGEGIPLADVLSHGVEHEPSAGLSAGPMGAPAQQGVPYKPNASFMSGPLSLADDLAGPATQQRSASAPAGAGEPPNHPTLKDLMEELSQHPDVLSQGVPEGIMSRTANNASGESSASLEAINRTRREQAEGQDRFLIDPDGKMWPVRGVEAADATAPKGSILVQKGIGGEPYSILDRGGLPRANAHGLLNRALAGGHGMTLMDLLSGDSG